MEVSKMFFFFAAWMDHISQRKEKFNTTAFNTLKDDL